MPRYKFQASSPNTITPAQSPPGNFTKISADDCKSVLEAGFPRVVQAIQALWGYKELNDYFRKLMIDETGQRDGFPPEAWEEIYLLQHLHQELVPDLNF
jgi:hypothetical protein